MSVKAKWHTASEAAVLDVDPFDEVPSAAVAAIPVSVPDMGLPINLDGSTASLDRRLADLLDAESALFNDGVSCDLKTDREVTCFACPLAATEGAMAALCAISREQEAVLTKLAVLRRHGDRAE